MKYCIDWLQDYHSLFDTRWYFSPRAGCSPVLRADISPLAVLGGGVVHLEKYLQKVGRRHLGRVVLQLNCLGVARVTGAYLRTEAQEASGYKGTHALRKLKLWRR